MKGLIIKDFNLVFQRKQSILIFLAVGVVMSFSSDPVVTASYLAILMTILCIGTLSYDDHDNGMLFIMTLPVTRKTYVIEKYIFCLGGGLIGCIFGMIIVCVIAALRGTANEVIEISSFLFIIPVIVVTSSVMIPCQLKFGAEKSRLALAVMATVIFGVFIIIKNTEMVKKIEISPISDSIVTIILATTVVIVFVLSYFVSLYIMQNKNL